MVADLHHEQDGVEDDESHDEVLKGRGDDDPPQLVLETLPLFWHVSFQGLRLCIILQGHGLITIGPKIH